MNNKEILIIMVLYKKRLEESETLISLGKVLSEKISIFVFDNSPVRQYENDNFEFDKFNIEYYHDYSNPGLSVAYNYALNIAKNKNYKYLLLLDQDTTLTKEYNDEVKALKFNNFSENVVAIIPRVISLLDKRIISPVVGAKGGIFRPINIPLGEVKMKISGINSGTLLKIDYLNSIGGFSEEYSLDMLDHWYFRKIFDDKKRIFLMDCKIFQDLSIYGNFEENISLVRYKQLITAEKIFIKEEGFFSLLIYKLRLIRRIIKQIRYKEKGYYKFTIKNILT